MKISKILIWQFLQAVLSTVLYAQSHLLLIKIALYIFGGNPRHSSWLLATAEDTLPLLPRHLRRYTQSTATGLGCAHVGPQSHPLHSGVGCNVVEAVCNFNDRIKYDDILISRTEQFVCTFSWEDSSLHLSSGPVQSSFPCYSLTTHFLLSNSNWISPELNFFCCSLLTLCFYWMGNKRWRQRYRTRCIMQRRESRGDIWY